MSFENNEETTFRFVDEEEVNGAFEQEEQFIEDQPQGEIQESSFNDGSQQTESYTDQDVDSAVFNYLSERLGKNVSSLDDLIEYRDRERAIDERIAVIAEFVEKTGRDPRDWFVYQSIDPSEMDDLSVIRLNTSAEYPNLSQEEIDLFVNSKYKLNPDVYGEDEVKLSSIQLRIDAAAARRSIEDVRNSYQLPQASASDYSSIVDESWVNQMRENLNDFEGIEFDLNGKKFTYGVDEDYKAQLYDKNTRLDEFFDPYVREDGSWDYDMLNMHRTVLDNINEILTSAYRQGMSDGQKNIVNKAANVSTRTPNQGGTNNGQDPLTEQLKEALGFGGGGIKFL
jgi:hypothetical protein